MYYKKIHTSEEKKNPAEKKGDGLEKKAVFRTAQDCGQKKLFLPKTPVKDPDTVMSDNISITIWSTSKSGSRITYK